MNWLALGFKLFPLIVAGVQSVERGIKGLKGQDKENAAVVLVQELMPLIEQGADKDLLNEPEVEKAARNAIRAIVAFQNTLAAVKAAKVESGQ